MRYVHAGWMVTVGLVIGGCSRPLAAPGPVAATTRLAPGSVVAPAFRVQAAGACQGCVAAGSGGFNNPFLGITGTHIFEVAGTDGGSDGNGTIIVGFRTAPENPQQLFAGDVRDVTCEEFVGSKGEVREQVSATGIGILDNVRGTFSFVVSNPSPFGPAPLMAIRFTPPAADFVTILDTQRGDAVTFDSLKVAAEVCNPAAGLATQTLIRVIAFTPTLNSAQRKTLVTQVESIATAIEADDVTSANARIRSFITQVEGLMRRNVVTVAEGERLIALANDILVALSP